MKLLNPERYTEASAALSEVDEENILVGPGRDPEEAITDLEGAHFFSIVGDTLYDAEVPYQELNRMETAKRVQEVLEMVRMEDAVIEMDCGTLIAPMETKSGHCLGLAAVEIHSDDHTELVGLFSGPSLAVPPSHQSKGIGTALTAAQLIHGGELPTWNHDKPGYSMDGSATMIKGFRAAMDLLDAIHIPSPGL